MNEPFQFLIGAGAVAAVVVLIWSGRLLLRLARELESLSKKLPGRAALEQQSANHRALIESLNAQRQLVKQLPELVATRLAAEVKSGLKPLNQELQQLSQHYCSALGQLNTGLSQSHEHFTRAVLTLNQDGSLNEWSEALREAAAPFQVATSALDHHYDTARQVLGTTSALVEGWAEQREAVQSAFGRFSEVVERSAAAETTHLRDIEHRVMHRLEEVAETNAAVAHSLSELQTASCHAMASHEKLGQSVDSTVQRVGELIDLGQQTQARHHELIRAQQEVQNGFGTWKSDMDTGIRDLRSQLHEMPRQVGQSLGKLIGETQASMRQLGGLLKSFQTHHAEALGKLREQHEGVARSQSQLVQKQERLLREASKLMANLSSRGFQLAQVVLQLLLLCGVLYGIYGLSQL